MVELEVSWMVEVSELDGGGEGVWWKWKLG